jgi:drug/metabolite transporter (DMT)-like permease
VSGARRSPYATLALAVLCVSSGSILVRYAQAPALSVAFYRMALASALLTPFALGPLRASWPRLDGRRRLVLAAAGLALALHFATWIASLSYTSVAVSVLLVNTAPAFALLLSRVFLGESVGPVVRVSIAIALVGAGLIAAGEWSGHATSLTGALLALIGAGALAVYHVIGRGLRDALPLNAYVLGVWGTSAVALALLAFVAGSPFRGHPATTWAAFFALALLPTLAGHGLVNVSLRHLAAPTVGLFLLGEPVAASILAWLLLGEVPGPWTLGGGLVVLAALAAVVVAGSRGARLGARAGAAATP